MSFFCHLSQCRNCRKAPNLKSEGAQCKEKLKLRRWAVGYNKTPIIRYRMIATERPSHGMFPFLALNKQTGKTLTKTGGKQGPLARARTCQLSPSRARGYWSRSGWLARRGSFLIGETFSPAGQWHGGRFIMAVKNGGYAGADVAGHSSL